ncbi:hypothetical protein CXF72_08530 [Psychromonas sp. MB-3u-54]|uniref:hypothetical protein n=1 Tax=Psychromonas sp. MB-3u-54 TaxID=2058319 RepID=UPI000C337D0F|nr:hypothetical protein [Psychromonas sp. MB-3u-54]PKH03045.1 hypothetical protein CXF72_08530 [Psychromonas sp. MB-3u-54]
MAPFVGAELSSLNRRLILPMISFAKVIFLARKTSGNYLAAWFGALETKSIACPFRNLMSHFFQHLIPNPLIFYSFMLVKTHAS